MAVKTFELPDLGEGLPEAEIVTWHVKEGDTVEVDQPLCSVETAKAVVEVPSPVAGTVKHLHGAEGDIIPTHGALVDFEVGGEVDLDEQPAAKREPVSEDSGTVVGNMPAGEEDYEETAVVRKKGRKGKQAASSDDAGGSVVTFKLPDLGEGLPEAEIVEWHVSEGDTVEVDQPLASVETAKAVVEVPSPHAGKVVKLHGAAGDVIPTHAPFADFQLAGGAGGGDGSKEKSGDDSGTVVGNMPSGGDDLEETAIIRKKGRRRDAKQAEVNEHGKVKAAPAARALCKELGIDIAQVAASGRYGQITKADVQAHAEGGTAPPSGARPPAAPPPKRAEVKYGDWEPLRGPRRAMHQSMTAARSQVMECTIYDDADIHGWMPGNDITARIIRALVAGCKAEPGFNAWYDGEEAKRIVHEHVDLAMAVDTPDGLIVPVLRDVGNKDLGQLRQDLNWMKEATRSRTVSPADMKDPTITLSNFGMMAGRYATPVVVPPQVAILGTGGIRHDVVPVLGGIETHKRIPLSLTFDHRCLTGGEACRFLAAVIEDLARPN